MSATVDQQVAQARALDEVGRHREAIGVWMAAFQADPTRVSSAIALAQSMAKLGQRAQAAEVLALAASLHPNNAEVLTVRGTLLRALGRHDEAIASHEQALQRAPGSVAIHTNLSAALASAGRFEPALGHADAALALEPGNALHHFNRGTFLLRLHRLDEARAALTTATALGPTSPDAWLNLGEVAVAAGDDATAEAHFRQALSHAPGSADAHFNLGLRLLARGAWKEGWAEYAWREQIASIPRRRVEGPRWDGQRLDGTLLVTTEQGLGDTLQFLRFIELARARCTRVVFEAPPALGALLAGPDVVTQGQPLPSYAAHASLLDFPGLLGGLSPPVPQRLVTRAPAWKRAAAVTVGVVWQGNPAYHLDARRSVPLRCFEPLSRVPGVSLVSLQKQHGRDQLTRWAGAPLTDLGATLDDGSGPFVETAGVLAQLDLLISSDTSVPHLAGLVGCPVWLLLSRPADWRWGADGETTPWYPGFRLFRQRVAGDWGEVFARVEAALRTFGETR
jgi:tetratricopeptide (TPR) repeat protein